MGDDFNLAEAALRAAENAKIDATLKQTDIAQQQADAQIAAILAQKQAEGIYTPSPTVTQVGKPPASYIPGMLLAGGVIFGGAWFLGNILRRKRR